jgi:hypothetical protein
MNRPDRPVYDHDGRTLLRITSSGDYTPIGEMCDEDMAAYVATVMNDSVAGWSEEDPR